MATDSTTSDFLAFRDFVGTLVETGRSDLTPEQSVSAFRDYQQQLARFQKENRAAVEQSERGEAKTLDVEALLDRVNARLAAEGSDR